MYSGFVKRAFRTSIRGLKRKEILKVPVVGLVGLGLVTSVGLMSCQGEGEKIDPPAEVNPVPENVSLDKEWVGEDKTSETIAGGSVKGEKDTIIESLLMIISPNPCSQQKPPPQIRP